MKLDNSWFIWYNMSSMRRYFKRRPRSTKVRQTKRVYWDGKLRKLRKRIAKPRKPRLPSQPFASADDKTRESRWRARGIVLTVPEYDVMLVSQGGVCAICKKEPGKNRLSVDHDHSDGRIRGLLCYICNRKIVGRHKTGILLRAAADYLDRT